MFDQETLDLWEQTRQGKNICPSCNKPKEMYYNPWCPRCEPPQLNSCPTLNLIQSLQHLEAMGHKDIKDTIWDWLCDNDYVRGNDTLTHICPPEDPLDDQKLEVALDVFFEFVRKQTGLEPDSILFEVSW